MRWTKENIEFLIKSYSEGQRIDLISKYLNRSKRAILHKVSRMGLIRDKISLNRPKDLKHRKEYDDRYYEKNKEKLYRQKKQRHLNLKLELVKMLGGKCSICNYDKCLAAFDFHHNFDKEAEIGRLLKDSSREKVLKEAKKCILLCANCHREFHYKGA